MPTFGEVLNKWLEEQTKEELDYYEPVTHFKRRRRRRSNLEKDGYEFERITENFELVYKKIINGNVDRCYISVPNSIIIKALKQYLKI